MLAKKYMVLNSNFTLDVKSYNWREKYWHVFKPWAFYFNKSKNFLWVWLSLPFEI